MESLLTAVAKDKFKMPDIDGLSSMANVPGQGVAAGLGVANPSQKDKLEKEMPLGNEEKHQSYPKNESVEVTKAFEGRDVEMEVHIPLVDDQGNQENIVIDNTLESIELENLISTEAVAEGLLNEAVGAENVVRESVIEVEGMQEEGVLERDVHNEVVEETIFEKENVHTGAVGETILDEVVNDDGAVNESQATESMIEGITTIESVVAEGSVTDFSLLSGEALDMLINRYLVNTAFSSIWVEIAQLYQDIVQFVPLANNSFKAACIKVVCAIVFKLKEGDLDLLLLEEIFAWDSKLQGLEGSKVEVKWLRDFLHSMSTALAEAREFT